MKNLAGKCVLVCGGATGIGAATVRRLLAEGARVGLGDLNLEGAQALASELSAEGDVVAWQYDQADETSINALVENATAHFGTLDGLFANVADIGAVVEETDLLGNDIALWRR
ncbi:MAG: SDR family NAD(P)-dependent oxidoreductase, partial [Halioglobus sp.]